MSLRNLTDIITIDRASNATYIDAAGIMQTATANTHRMDYDPYQLTLNGLLCEDTITNSILYSSDITNASYSKLNCTATANTITNPMGGTTMDLIANPGGGGVNHRVSFGGNLSFTAGTPVLFAQFAKKGPTGGKCCMRIQGVYPNMANICFNFDTETFDFAAVTSSFTSIKYGYTKFSNGIYRLWLSAIPNATISTGVLAFGPSSLASDTWEGPSSTASDMYVWGRDLYLNSDILHSHIPTTASTVTKLKDLITISGNTFTNSYSSNTGTIYVEAKTRLPSSTTVYNVVEISDNTADNRHRIVISNTSIGGTTTSNGIVQTDLLKTGYANNTTFKAVYAYESNNAAFTINGNTVLGNTSITLPSTLNRITIGSSSVVSAKGLNGHIRAIKYFPTRLPNTHLVSLTS